MKNSDFNKGLSHWRAPTRREAFQWIDFEGHKGYGALAVQSIPPSSAKKNRIYQVIMSQCIKLDNGSRYQFSASFKPKGKYQSKHTNRVNLYWYQSDDCKSGGEFGGYLEPVQNQSGWQHIEVERERALNAQSVRIEINQSRASANNQVALWDNIELKPIAFTSKRNTISANVQYTKALGVNYLKNPDFNSNIDHWRFTGDTTWARIPSSGSGAARLALFSSKGGLGTHDFSQCVNLGKHRIYSFGARVLLDPASTQEGGGILRLSWHKYLNCEGPNQAGFNEDRIESVGDWQNLKVNTITAPKNVQSAKVYFTRGINNSGHFAYFIDNVFFKAID